MRGGDDARAGARDFLKAAHLAEDARKRISSMVADTNLFDSVVQCAGPADEHIAWIARQRAAGCDVFIASSDSDYRLLTLSFVQGFLSLRTRRLPMRYYSSTDMLAHLRASLVVHDDVADRGVYRALARVRFVTGTNTHTYTQ